MNKTWGGRFKKPLDPRVQAFHNSLEFDHVLFHYDIMGSIAHAKMLAKQSLILPEEADLIIQGLEAIRANFESGQCPLDIAHEDIHMFIEHLLIQHIGEVGKKLHTGRSRNDQVALDMRLYAREAGQTIAHLCSQLIATLQSLSRKHQKDSMPGYTHLQQAQPVTLGNHLGAYAAMFARDLSRIKDWHQRMNVSPLGAGALAGSQLPLDRAYVASLLGFDGVIENTLDAVSDRDYLIEFCSLASILMMHLSRLCEDLILWASSEFNFLHLDDSFATGSSLMPNKKNPDVPELVRGKSGRVFGHVVALLTMMKGLPLSYNKDMQEDKEPFFDTVKTLKACLGIMTPFLTSITFNTESMQQASQQGYLNATEVLETLVLKGVPFRDAHHQVGRWIYEAMEKQQSLQDYLESYGISG